MILANHVPAALIVWKAVSLIFSGLPQIVILAISVGISFFSHFLLDSIPHEDWSFAKGELDRKKIISLAFIDVGLAVLVWFVVSFSFLEINFAGFLCAFVSCAPDLNKFIKYPRFIEHIHEQAHHSWRKNGKNERLPTWQLAFVIFIIAVSVFHRALGF